MNRIPTKEECISLLEGAVPTFKAGEYETIYAEPIYGKDNILEEVCVYAISIDGYSDVKITARFHNGGINACCYHRFERDRPWSGMLSNAVMFGRAVESLLKKWEI